MSSEGESILVKFEIVILVFKLLFLYKYHAVDLIM
jgi:hypothetical protein